MTASPEAPSSVEVEVTGRVLHIWLNRPEAHNSIDRTIASGLEAAIDRLEGDDGLWVGLLSGRGPSFCAGADLKAVARGEWPALFTERGGFAGIARRQRKKPIVAGINGPAVGGGFELALACDLIVASTAATFGFPEVRRSTLPVGGGLVRLAREVGELRALRLMLTGDLLPARELAQWGLVTEVAEPAEAFARAHSLAHRVAENAPLAVRACLHAVRAGRDQSEAERWTTCDDLALRVMTSQDALEGLAAFMGRRPAVWQGR